ncbi:MAG: Zn-ribbon containing protein [Candidatus Micrarchaeia archaeon]|jgi:predicted  nucleic acid-binding Zn-ribbon protein
MPHKCVKCGKVYGNASPQLLSGCECGNRVFLFMKPEQMSLKELYEHGLDIVVDSKRIIELSADKPVSIELDLESLQPELAKKPDAGQKPPAATGTQPAGARQPGQKTPAPQTSAVVPPSAGNAGVSASPEGGKAEKMVENIRVVERGCYELDLESLMGGNPLVVRSQGGIYYVKIQAFKRGDPNAPKKAK